jgi:ATP-binding cassette subfamily F protein uup
MPLLRLSDVSIAYGHVPLLAHVDFEIDRGERVCLVGRNGAGKSTLFRVVSGQAMPDEGEVWRPPELRIAHLEQEVPADSEASVFDIVAGGLGELGKLLADYHHAAAEGRLEPLATLQTAIESRGGWNLAQKVETVLSRLNLPADRRLADCSGGIRRQVLLARSLVSDPDLLLLDEPTNHLDIAAITWLEQYLLDFHGALVFITHDRAFLRRIATRLIELDRGRLTSFPGDFESYLAKKDELLEIEARHAAHFDKKLAEEEAWIRQGIKARRKRNQGRVRALESLRRDRAARLDPSGTASFALDGGALSGKLVVDLRHVNFRFGDHWIVRDFSTRILRGDRIGIVGPNGCGKSTLLKLILGELQPTGGEVVSGTRLTTGYFDQHRGALDPDKSVRDNLGEGRDYISVQGRSRHIVGYLRDFLFPFARIDSPVKTLSGGERNRLMLARLFTQPANLLVLDEPTNDLDVDTLELLEDLLADYEGTLLIVSHDRAFLDNVVTSTIVFEGEGRLTESVGGYTDWLAARSRAAAPERKSTKSAPPAARSAPPPRAGSARKLSYKEQRELEALPGRIETLEAEQARLHAATGDPAFYRQESEQIAATMTRLDEVNRELEVAYQRWATLESLAVPAG